MPATCLIGGVSYIMIEDQHDLTTNVDERGRFQCDVIDYSGTAHFTPRMQVVISDPVLGIIFSGYLNSDKEVLEYPSGAILHTIDCVDPRYLADKRTYTRTYATPASAGKIVIDQLHDVLSAEGVATNYALHFDTTPSDFTAGILSNTSGTANVGDGDLEITPAGSIVTYSEKTTADFAAGTLSNCTAANNSLAPTSTQAIKMLAIMSDAQLSQNTITSVMIWSGSQAVSGNTWLEYDVFISPSSPQAKMAVDLNFSDKTTFSGVASIVNGNEDGQFILPGPSNDLTGLATTGWYHRKMLLPAKTITSVILVCAGTNPGTYTGYFKNIQFTGNSPATIFNGTLNVSPPQQLQVFGYSSTSVTVVPTYDLYVIPPNVAPLYGAKSSKITSSTSMTPVGLLKSSFFSFQANIPANTALTITYSIDGGNSYIQCINNAPLPGLPAGRVLSGLSIQFAYGFFALPGASVEACPTLLSVALTLSPAAQTTKFDVGYSAVTQANWNAGTLTNLIANSLGELTLNGAIRTWDDGSTANQSFFFSGGSPNQSVNNRAFTIWNLPASTMEAKSQFNFAGQWQNFTAEMDIQISDDNIQYGLLYRTTGWQNANNTFGYVAFLTTTGGVELGRGTNTSSGGGGYTQIQNVAATFTKGSWHRLKVVVSGNSHTVYVDNIQYISATDSTWTAAGYFGIRVYDFNVSGGPFTATFDNFGVAATLSGQWVSPSTALVNVGMYGTSVITWRDKSQSYNGMTNTSILVEASIDGGTTYQTCTNGAAIPNFTPGQSTSSNNLVIRATLTSSSAVSLAAMDMLLSVVLGAYSASGTRSTIPLGNDVMVRTNQSGWGTAFDGQSWVKVGTGTDAIASNEGTIANTTGDVHEVLGSRTWTDEDATVRFQLSTVTITGGEELRYTDVNNYYRLAVSTTTISLIKVSQGVSFTLATVSASLTTNTSYRMRFRVVGSNPVNLYGKVWLDGTLEPGVVAGVPSTTNHLWTITATD